ncbi:MAG TPA: HPr kinase/phosphorylase [Rhizobiaceae bacterium]|nr:HPr kinase/phosphorylase [Rhizobiaceae bacterium]
MAASNFHATGVVLGTRGLLITGPSGSGKTALALALIDAWRAQGQFSRLIADDQVLLSVSHGRLIAQTPDAIAGLVEVFGIGPKPVDYIGQAVIDGLCELVPAVSAPRFQEDDNEVLHGCHVPKIRLAELSAHTTMPTVLAWIGGIAAR